MKTDPTSPKSPSPRKHLELEMQAATRSIQVFSDPRSDAWLGTVDGEAAQAEVCLLRPGILSLLVDGHVYQCVLEQTASGSAVYVDGERFSFAVHDPRALSARRFQRAAADGDQTIKAPMPGRIVRVLVQVGDQVTAHQPVLAIEAMKMQNELRAAQAGTVKQIKAEAGQTVAAGEILMLLA